MVTRNPTRRSRNIGTAKQGHGQNNTLVIPTRTHPEVRIFVANLGFYSSEKRPIWEEYSRLLNGKDETLPHEIGHHLHSPTDEEFWRRTKREREEFAEKCARDFLENRNALRNKAASVPPTFSRG